MGKRYLKNRLKRFLFLTGWMQKGIFLFFILYFLVLFQTSFFNFLTTVPNFILVFLLLVLVFEKNENLKLINAFWAGFLLDIFSNLILGTTILTLIFLYILIKIILKNLREINLPIFSGLIVISTLFFELFLPLSSFFFSKIFNSSNLLQFNFGYFLFLKLIYNLILGLIGFLILNRLNSLRNYEIFTKLRKQLK